MGVIYKCNLTFRLLKQHTLSAVELLRSDCQCTLKNCSLTAQWHEDLCEIGWQCQTLSTISKDAQSDLNEGNRVVKRKT